ncbi:MAG TPA: hypothetical protein VGD47_01005 [Steroidobacteraceae bacterium]
MTAIPNFASARASAEAGYAAPAASAVPFVLNLCSSTTPMALAQTDLPELKRFTFFVSRRFEEGRERFRLHMGYFATLAEAEEWLSVVREIYPGAWAGEAPGRKLRERATAAAAAQARHAAGPQPQAAPAAKRVPAPAPAAAAAPASAVPNPAAVRVPVVHAALPASPRAAPPVVAPPAMPAPVARPVAPRSSAPTSALRLTGGRVPPPAPARIPRISAQTAPPTPVTTQSAPPAVVAQLTPAQTPPRTPAATRAAAPPAARAAGKSAKPVFEDSNVREVLAALGDASATGETRLMRAPPPPMAPAESDSLTDTQVLKMLEIRRPPGGEPPATDVAAHGGIALLKPHDTQTRRALKEAVFNNAPVSFAVQLQWSVQPAELDKVPALAIFSAYTLYTVEGSREGRKWYGLRLGFFTDAISAKQVAHYVRSEFTSVAVVPVSPQEKASATEQTMQAATLAAPAAARAHPVDEFKLIDDDTANMATAALLRGKPQAAKSAAKPVPKVAVGRTVRQPASPAKGRTRGGGKVGARERRGPHTLEETLEILGASQLAIDDGTGATLNDSGVRHLRVEVHKDSPFSRLLERLSERMKKA